MKETWRDFRELEYELILLHRRRERLLAFMLVWVVLAILCVAVPVTVVAMGSKAVWVMALLVGTVPCFIGMIYCFLRWASLGSKEMSWTESQKKYYLVLSRREWRNQHQRTDVPNWQIIDKWEKKCHYYRLFCEIEWSTGGPSGHWEDPMADPREA